MIKALSIQERIQTAPNSPRYFSKDGVDDFHEGTCSNSKPRNSISRVDHSLMIFDARVDRVE